MSPVNGEFCVSQNQCKMHKFVTNKQMAVTSTFENKSQR